MKCHIVGMNVTHVQWTVEMTTQNLILAVDLILAIYRGCEIVKCDMKGVRVYRYQRDCESQ